MPAVSAKDELAKRLESFHDSEASARLEGIDPLQFPIYVAMKERILSGEITNQEAMSLILDEFEKAQKSAA